ncbi:hypothetical protein IFM89_012582 [Coptis chinensis]|uniref:Phytocyanin domain-containing protein n=1 Tax=Coptis chinensis TaxID=261450 RepID=A0A835H7V5_9MAGN|nr:hypothetical protein IFM89_012582 [Coptis chinensis]
MKPRCSRGMNIPFFFFFSCLIFLSFSGSFVHAYKNYTVGDSLGWYDKLKKPTVNYQKWVAGKNFSLGDFLMFNTDSNHSVVQSYNFTTYKRCDYDNAENDDTTQWSQGEPSAVTPDPVFVAVPLLKEGMTYFFSGDYDGEQCKHGQRFKMNVTHGLGLPASLKNPPAVAQSPRNQDDADSTPDPETTISSDFNHPKESGNDNAKNTSGSISLKLSMKLMNIKLNGIIGLLGIVWICY